jgi:hypothetical protein
MLHPMKITVTAEHIRYGRPCDLLSCPVALAIRDAEWAAFPWVTGGAVEVLGTRINVSLPEEACRFISAFDSGMVVSPFEFDLPGGRCDD